MFRALFLLFLVVPIVEIALLLKVSDIIGGAATLAWVIITAYFGAKFVKQQGLNTLADVQRQTAQGQLPGAAIFSGVCLLIAGVLLLTPGLMTDALGFLLLVPAVRTALANSLMQQAAAKVQSGQAQFVYQSYSESHTRQGQTYEHQADEMRTSNSATSDRHTASQRPSLDVIEGQFERKD